MLVMVIMQTELWSLLDGFVQGGPLQCDALVQSIVATTVINNPTPQQYYSNIVLELVVDVRLVCKFTDDYSRHVFIQRDALVEACCD